MDICTATSSPPTFAAVAVIDSEEQREFLAVLYRAFQVECGIARKHSCKGNAQMDRYQNTHKHLTKRVTQLTLENETLREDFKII